MTNISTNQIEKYIKIYSYSNFFIFYHLKALDEANTRTSVLTQELTKSQKIIGKSKKASEVALLIKVRIILILAYIFACCDFVKL